MVLRVLNKILEIPKLGETPGAHLGPIWPNLAKIWPNKTNKNFGNPQAIRHSYEGVGGYIWELFGKNIEFKVRQFYLRSEGNVQLLKRCKIQKKVVFVNTPGG